MSRGVVFVGRAMSGLPAADVAEFEAFKKRLGRHKKRETDQVLERRLVTGAETIAVAYQDASYPPNERYQDVLNFGALALAKGLRQKRRVHPFGTPLLVEVAQTQLTEFGVSHPEYQGILNATIFFAKDRRTQRRLSHHIIACLTPDGPYGADELAAGIATDQVVAQPPVLDEASQDEVPNPSLSGDVSSASRLWKNGIQLGPV